MPPLRPTASIPGIAAAAFAALALALSAEPSVAQTLTESQARAQVAAPRGVDVRVAELPGLDGAQLRQLEQAAAQYPYYAAFVVAPGDPQANQSGLTVVNMHSPEEATRSALAACEQRRTTGAPCIVLAQTFPRRYEPGQLTLSREATEALRGEFRQMDSPKALAISPSTGQFGFARGDGARAMADCNAKASEQGAQDCRIVVADP